MFTHAAVEHKRKIFNVKKSGDIFDKKHVNTLNRRCELTMIINNKHGSPYQNSENKKNMEQLRDIIINIKLHFLVQ